MISVPEEVKNALRDGMLKKEYRFEVCEQGVYVDIGDIREYGSTIEEDGYYMLHCTRIFYVIIPAHDEERVPVFYNPATERYETEKREFSQGTELNVTYIGGTQVIVAKLDSERINLLFTIGNDHLVSESVKFDERMCSSDTLKFGLCEGTSLEFQYFGYPAINGDRIRAYLDVQYGADQWHTINMGWYTVSQCPMQASTGIRKVTAYNKLQSAYLDSVEYTKALIEEGESGVTGEISIYTLLKDLLGDYTIYVDPEIRTVTDKTYNVGSPSQQSIAFQEYVWELYEGGYAHLYTIGFFYKATDQGSNEFYRYSADLADIYEYASDIVGSRGITIKVAGRSISLYDFGKGAGAQLGAGLKMSVYNMDGERLYQKVYFLIGNADTVEYLTNNGGAYFEVPIYCEENSYEPVHPSIPTEIITTMRQNLDELMLQYGLDDFCMIRQEMLSEIEKQRITVEDIGNSGVTIRELQSAVFEMNCQFGKLDRVTDLFSGVTLNGSRLVPAESLYPQNSLYPDGAAADSNLSYYQNLWTDNGGPKKFRYLIITYKCLNSGNETEDRTLQRTVNPDGTENYNMSDNWLFRNLIWTEQQIGEYADAMAALMRNITWFPFEMWASGLPYIETGDEIEITTKDGTYTSYIMQRMLSGIHNLQDTYINGELDIF